MTSNLDHTFDLDTAAVALPDAGDGGAEARFSVSLSRRWWVARGPNGGYVAAVMLRAMEQVAAGRPVRSLTIQFPKAPREGDAEVRVKTVKAGRTITFLAAEMHQDGEPVLTGMGVFGSARDGLIGYAGADAHLPEDAGEVGELVALDTATPGVPPVFANFSFRAIGQAPFTADDGEARTAGWIRAREPRSVDAPLATAILDVWFPAPFVKLSEPVAAPTLDFTVHFRTALPLARAADDDAYLIDVRSSFADEGYFEEDARLWHADGTLIAHSRQLALI